MPKAVPLFLWSSPVSNPNNKHATVKVFNNPLNKRNVSISGKFGKCRGFDADRKGTNRDRVVGYDKIEITAVQAAFSREIAAEIKSVIAGLKANEIVVTQGWNKTFVVGQRGKYFRRRAGNVKKKANAIFVPTLAECLCERHQMIIMHPHQIFRPKHLMQLTRKVIVDP